RWRGTFAGSAFVAEPAPTPPPPAPIFTWTGLYLAARSVTPLAKTPSPGSGYQRTTSWRAARRLDCRRRHRVCRHRQLVGAGRVPVFEFRPHHGLSVCRQLPFPDSFVFLQHHLTEIQV